WTRGGHTLKFGMSARRLQSNLLFIYRNGGAWSFNGLSSFLQGTAATLAGPLPGRADGIRDFREWDYEPYIQDDWKVTPRLTLNIGLRYEPTSNPVERRDKLTALVSNNATGFTHVSNVFQTNPSLKNFDPRIGLAYDPFADHKTSIRAGFGMFHEPILPAVYAVGFQSVDPYVVVQQANASYPTPFVGVQPGLPTASPGWDWRTRVTPYMIQYNLTVQREVAQGTVLSLGYVGSHGVHLFTSVDQNPPIPVIDPNGT